MSTNRKWTPEQIKAVKKMVEAGSSANQIALVFRCSKNAICGLVSRNGIKRKEPKREPLVIRPRLVPRAPSRNYTPLPKAVAPSPGAVVGIRDVAVLADEPKPIGKEATPGPDGTCKWVHGDTRTSKWKYCGHQVRKMSAFCHHHHSRAYHEVPYKGGVIPLRTRQH